VYPNLGSKSSCRLLLIIYFCFFFFFFLLVVFTCVLICHVLLMDGFLSLTYIYMFFFLAKENRQPTYLTNLILKKTLLGYKKKPCWDYIKKIY
jgi:hypothetical protein